MSPHPLDFFRLLKWIDGRPLGDVLEPYRCRIFEQALFTFGEDGRPRYTMVLCGRAKKNWKTTDLILAALYRLLVWESPHGNDCFLLANDEGQAADDLKLATKLVAANPMLRSEVDVRAKEIVRRDGRGALTILPAGDVVGAHGKTYSFVGFDEIHGYRNWDLLEALAPDPTRPDALTWITSYASYQNTRGAPLVDLFEAGIKKTDPRMLFSWYSADYTTDPDFEDATPEERANPSMGTWADPGYLQQQKARLPAHKYRRLHLNLPGSPEDAFVDAETLSGCVGEGRRNYPPHLNIDYVAFVDMSGGSSDDATLAIAHELGDGVIVDAVIDQGQRAPFNPRRAVDKFVDLIQQYQISFVVGDHYAGETFRRDFQERGIDYEVCDVPKRSLYDHLEPMINAGMLELPDHPKLIEQLLGLVRKGRRVDHRPGEHDDWANAVAGAVYAAKHHLPPLELYVFGEY